MNCIFGLEKNWNLVFSISGKVVENWISFQAKPIPNQLEFWAESYSQNTKQVQKITQIQHHLQLSFKFSNGDQHQISSSLSNGLIPSLSFRRKLLRNKLDRKTDTFYEKFQKTEKRSKNVTIFSSKLNCIFGLKNVKIWFYLFLWKLQKNWICFLKTLILNQLEFWEEI